MGGRTSGGASFHSKPKPCPLWYWRIHSGTPGSYAIRTSLTAAPAHWSIRTRAASLNVLRASHPFPKAFMRILYVAGGSCAHACQGRVATLGSGSAPFPYVPLTLILFYSMLYSGWPRANVDQLLLRFSSSAASANFFRFLKPVHVLKSFLL